MLPLVALLSLAGTARAQTQSTRPPGAMKHDGFYLRFGTGFGAYDETAISGERESYEGRLRARTRGFVVAGELAMGGTPYEGLVIGGGIYTTQVYTSSVAFNKHEELVKELGVESREFSLVGVFIDRYFVPTLGMHVQAALGIAGQSGFAVDSDVFEGDQYAPAGPGVMLGLGYEAWIGEQFSLGVLARFSGAILFGRDANHAPWVHYITAFPGFLMTLTYH